MADEMTTEQELQAKGLNAPRVRPEDLDAEMAVAEVSYMQPAGTTVTVCCAVLSNGYCLVGKSAAVSPENFDEKIGQQVAFRDAREQLWALLGFRLKDQLAGA